MRTDCATLPVPLCHLEPETPPQAAGVSLQIPGPVTKETSGATCFLLRQQTGGGPVPSKILGMTELYCHSVDVQAWHG